MDRLDDLAARGALQEVAGGTQAHGIGDVARPVGSGQHQHLGGQSQALQLGQQVEAGPRAEAQVQHQQVKPRTLQLLAEGLSAAGSAVPATFRPMVLPWTKIDAVVSSSVMPR